SLSAASAAIASFTVGTALLLSGTLLFMVSDGILSFEMFRSETKASHLRVMVPYLAGQTLIASGFLLSLA
ncbi:MAG: lysoplasmalogenase family protein, partial [Bacillota bacterium]